MTTAVPVAHADRFFIGGKWETPSTDSTFEVIEAPTEEKYFTVAEARRGDVERAIAAARTAFDEGPWPGLSHAQRAEHLKAIAAGLIGRSEDIAQIWPRQSGALYSMAQYAAAEAANFFNYYADLAGEFPFVEPHSPTAGGELGLLVREPVGVVGAIVPWNAPIGSISVKVAPALLAGCTVVIKPSPDAPGEAYVLAEIAEAAGLPPGVVNVVTADREAAEILVTDPRVDKIAFTGSTAAGRRIASLMGERIGRFTLELGGKSAAVILDDADIDAAAANLSFMETLVTGQVCSTLTRVVVTRRRHDEVVEALVKNFGQVKVGDPFAPDVQMGPLAGARHRERVEGYIAKGLAEGADLATGGRRPAGLERGFFIEPTVFANVDNSSTIAQQEIFGPVLSVIPVADEAEAVRVANDTIYGLNASVFTASADKALAVARQLRAGTVGHNAFRSDFGIAFGGFKQSGVGREGGREGVLPYVELKTVILDGTPSSF
ncbi:aldehyde dehydrogenase [Amycolatopsis sp. K13G38]|uniref:Aldehyde dehydrogenase n=1 Tax=Amycolatopsis acididurans TaxID=2724524 RepID=A0ABX1JE89_9PSEU|nr:aldehyde dehydrogenase [Amycolatopsis acididurans]NKQ58053.1 aldehyde dehydrogenase [Amycolatopsis acididurans]